MQAEHTQLIRGLGLIGAVSVNVANIIGTGVFLKARVMTCNVGTPGKALIVWVVAGLLALAGALTYAELLAMMPRAAGEYGIIRDAYGRPLGFIYGWAQFLIARTASAAALADINIATTQFGFEILGIETEIASRSSSMADKSSDPTQRLIDICKHVGADTYLAGAGGSTRKTVERERQPLIVDTAAQRHRVVQLVSGRDVEIVGGQLRLHSFQSVFHFRSGVGHRTEQAIFQIGELV